ncbi:putative GNS1/SUR4 family protein [Elsinoe australis]|uniref:Elongation of fatty acids protein n=1 Tax=Elsinoe australis TaxID=40998 RepID=A0A4U7AXF6_9PEZI|nr:putative GNS1/SUR4 family protein [Elsinoe australis]
MASVYLTSPPSYLFKFPPDPHPYAIPPPSDEPSIRAPFRIPREIYQGALQPKVPLTFAICYITIVLSLNAYNRSRGWKPWWIARTKAFTPLVAFHNLTLAIYSGITFAAMCHALYNTWPVMDYNTTPADIADALCKINGPRGLGDAVTYNATQNVWSSKNSIIKLASGLPDSTDVGRLWNEGLAFWGWFFYLSKFYEVLDTLVILARGKRSPTLQTYHHAGAMLCMWAGIRYMSPPIWMFCFINSFIHTLMYIYFTLATLGIKVPMGIKQTLTTMQIAQFLFGATFAAFHLFIQYDIPVTTAYKILSPVSSVASAASSVVSSLVHEAPSSVSSAVASATASPALGAVLKRLLLRAAGGEGPAENVRDSYDHLIPGVSSAHSSASSAASSAAAAVTSSAQQYKEETRYKSSIATVDCIDTTGQSFAIWLNIFYLAPLTFLFLRFFVKAYITGTLNKGKPNRRTSFTEAASRAAADVRRETDNAGKEVERRLSEQVARDVSAVREGRFDMGTKKGSDNKKSDSNAGAEKPKDLSQSQSNLSPESAIQDESGDEGTSELDNSISGSMPNTPEKKKKKRNKHKKKNHDAQHAGEQGVASFADVTKE